MIRGHAHRWIQAAVGLWLLVSIPVFDTTQEPVLVIKDSVAGAALLAVSLAAAVTARARALEPLVCLAAGLLLIVGAALLEFGSGAHAPERQWNEVLVGVLLVCLWGVRER